MRPLAAVAVLVAACGTHAPAPPPPANTAPAPEGDWFPVLSGKLVAVSVERAVYDQHGDRAHFLVHVRIASKVARPIDVDLRSYDHIVYPNQWEVSDVDHRTVIDETRVGHDPVDDATVVAAASAGQLTRVPAGGTLDVYRDFNGPAGPTVDAQPGKYLLIALDGHLVVTDGHDVEQLYVADDEASRILVVPAPVAWKPVPDGARLMVDTD